MTASSTSRARFLTRLLQGAAVAGALALGVMGLSSQSIAATAADTVIQNQATATYTDANNNSYTAQSNLAKITVAQIYSAELSDDHSSLAAAGQTMYFSHLLKNTGNGTDTYTASAANSAGDSGDFNSFKVYQDTNKNGQVDAGEVEVGNITLVAGAETGIVVEATVPGNAIATNTFKIKLNVTAASTAEVTDTGADGDGTHGTNDDTAVVTGNAILNITKSSTYVDQGTSALDDDRILYTVTVTNTGNGTADDVILFDGIPANTTFDATYAAGIFTAGLASNGFGSNTGDVVIQAGELSETNLATKITTIALVDLNGDGDEADDTEADLDMNLDNSVEDPIALATAAQQGVFGFDAALPPNTTINFSYAVKLTSPTTIAAGTLIHNIGHVTGDVDNDGTYDTGGLPDTGEVNPSNRVTDVIPQIYAVVAEDSGDGADALWTNTPTDGDHDWDTNNDGLGDGGGIDNVASPGVNDGHDDDDANDDIQQVDTAPAGEEVLFLNEITNNSNGVDTIELVLNAGTPDSGTETIGDGNPHVEGAGFPTGTVFTVWDETGSVQLLDSNGNGTRDTGPLASGAKLTVMVKAQLPAGVYVGDDTHTAPFTAVMTATSAGDSSVSDTKSEQLLTIVGPAVDLSNGVADNLVGTNNEPATAYDTGAAQPANVNLARDPITTLAGNLGTTVSFTLNLQNDSGVPDAFQFSAGKSWQGSSALGGMHTGWSVVFKDSGGNIVTTTPAIAPAGTYSVTALVTIPSDPTQAVADFTPDLNGDSTDDPAKVDDNANNNGGIGGDGDGDGDYPVYFMVKSINSGAYDVKLDAVDVNPAEDITLLPNNSGQIQPGGSIDYPHTLANSGNTDELVNLSAVNSESGNGWATSLLVDTTGDGVPDTPFGSLTVADGDKVWILNASNVPTQVALVEGDASDAGAGVPSVPAIPLGPNESMPIVARVFAPSSAPNGTLDTATITAMYNYDSIDGTLDSGIPADDDSFSTVTATDLTEVILGQLRLVKTVALDADCGGVPDENLAVIAATAADPQDCAVWQIVATNQGTAAVDNVEIFDTFPVFTQKHLVNGANLRSCKGDAGLTAAGTGCTTTYTNGINDAGGAAAADFSNTDAIADAEAGHSDGFVAEVNASVISFTIGTIAPGASVTVRFMTQVE